MLDLWLRDRGFISIGNYCIGHIGGNNERVPGCPPLCHCSPALPHASAGVRAMCKIVRNCAIFLQTTTHNLTLTHALAMTLTPTSDPNFNPNSIAIPHFTVPLCRCPAHGLADVPADALICQTLLINGTVALALLHSNFVTVVDTYVPL